jgi:hypothetical protein
MIHTSAPEAVAFFHEHAGFSWNPTTGETPEQGQQRTAERLAEAEAWAEASGYTVEWADDWAVDHVREFDCYEGTDGPSTCEVARLVDSSGDVVQSVGCVDDATDSYRRVIAAELALEIMPEGTLPGAHWWGVSA